jgi:hypothetical protein
MESFNTLPANALQQKFSELSALLLELVQLGEKVFQSNPEAPSPDSPLFIESEELKAKKAIPHKKLELLTTDSFRYLATAGQHCLAVSNLLRTGEVAVSLPLIIRGQVETYGRLGWLLEPGKNEETCILPAQRVARHQMELLASLCRLRFTAGKRKRPKSEIDKICQVRDELRSEMLTMFPGAELTWDSPRNEENWSCGGEKYVGLGKSVAQFDKIFELQAKGLYDVLSDFTHPSLISTGRALRTRDEGGHSSYYWEVEGSEVAIQVWTSAAMHSVAIKLMASWLGLATLCETVDEIMGRIASLTRAM